MTEIDRDCPQVPEAHLDRAFTLSAKAKPKKRPRAPSSLPEGALPIDGGTAGPCMASLHADSRYEKTGCAAVLARRAAVVVAPCTPPVHLHDLRHSPAGTWSDAVRQVSHISPHLPTSPHISNRSSSSSLTRGCRPSSRPPRRPPARRATRQWRRCSRSERGPRELTPRVEAERLRREAATRGRCCSSRRRRSRQCVLWPRGRREDLERMTRCSGESAERAPERAPR